MTKMVAIVHPSHNIADVLVKIEEAAKFNGWEVRIEQPHKDTLGAIATIAGVDPDSLEFWSPDHVFFMEDKK